MRASISSAASRAISNVIMGRMQEAASTQVSPASTRKSVISFPVSEGMYARRLPEIATTTPAHPEPPPCTRSPARAISGRVAAASCVFCPSVRSPQKGRAAASARATASRGAAEALLLLLPVLLALPLAGAGLVLRFLSAALSMDDMGASIALGLCLSAKRDRLGRAAQGFCSNWGGWAARWAGRQTGRWDVGWAGRQTGRWDGDVQPIRLAPNNALVRNGASDK